MFKTIKTILPINFNDFKGNEHLLAKIADCAVTTETNSAFVYDEVYDYMWSHIEDLVEGSESEIPESLQLEEYNKLENLYHKNIDNITVLNKYMLELGNVDSESTTYSVHDVDIAMNGVIFTIEIDQCE